MVVGSGPGADIQLDLAEADPEHARVSPTEGGWLLEDLGSTHGTWLGWDTRLDAPERLEGNASFHIGQKRQPGSTLSLPNMTECLARIPDDQGRAWFVRLDGQSVGNRPVPLAETLRREKPRSSVRRLAASQADVLLDVEPGATEPDCPGLPSPWPVRQITLSESGRHGQLALTGPDDRQAILRIPAQFGSIGPILQVVATSRPMAERLTAAFLDATGPTCRHVVIGPSDIAEPPPACVCIARGDRSAWFDAHPIEAVGLAAATEPTASVWVCEAPCD